MERPLTKNIKKGREPLGLKEYEMAGGYQSVRKALKTMTPEDIVKEVKESNLRGRGGAGFPVGTKWGFVPTGEGAREARYLIVNTDEMEPGTFKDRFLLEGDPHQLIEGIIVSAYAIQASRAYIFLRKLYTRVDAMLEKAVAEAYDSKYLGMDILGSGYSLELFLHLSSGRYICGEETALLNSLEGKRAIPRSKPPYTALVGLWGEPTIVNNAETICNVPHIVNRGASWYKKLSKSEDGGTKIYGASGRVNNPGAWELPMGTTIREILEEHAGGMREGYRLKGLLPGGASTDFLIEEHLDVKMDFDSVQQAGSRMGTGTIVVLDDQTCPVGMVLNLEQFFARESCGWCTPCREGLPLLVKILREIEEGRGNPEDLGVLQTHARLLGPGHTFCALAPGAMEPLGSALKYFRADFDQHINEKRCPWS